MVLKEFIQMRRDRITFAMMVGIPMMQLILFGFAINSDPKHLPTGVLCADAGRFGRALIQAMRSSEYFQFVRLVETEAEGQRLLAQGDLQFVVSIPVDFERRLIRGERPALLVEADATDPAATGNALGAFDRLAAGAIHRELLGPLQHLAPGVGAFEIRVHRRYNEEGITQYNVVPGLVGVVLTMTMVIITALAITRERERGTMENLLSTPVKPLEVMVGKIVPYIVVGYIQISLVLLAARYLFDVPFMGHVGWLYLAAFLFIAANLAMGITFSTIARNQLQAVQMAFFFFLPSLLLSGFMFPFRGMPEWAQTLGNLLPLTHFLRAIRGLLLKGNAASEIIPHLWPIATFLVVTMTIGLVRYRRTLD